MRECKGRNCPSAHLLKQRNHTLCVCYAYVLLGNVLLLNVTLKLY